MMKRAEWMQISENESALTLGPFEVCAWLDVHEGVGFMWIAHGCSTSAECSAAFPTLALAQADAVRWLRKTIAEMAAMLPEVE